MTVRDGTLAMVAFRAGGLRFAVEASSVVAMLTDADNTVAFATLIGLEPARSVTRTLAVRQQEAIRRIVVEEPVTTIDVPFHAIRPLPPLVAARLTRPCIRALMWDEDGLVILTAFPEPHDEKTT